eukprot:1161009-Pelagomonas_calceolata.AAC.4
MKHCRKATYHQALSHQAEARGGPSNKALSAGTAVSRGIVTEHCRYDGSTVYKSEWLIDLLNEQTNVMHSWLCPSPNTESRGTIFHLHSWNPLFNDYAEC